MTIYYCGTGQAQTTIAEVNALSLVAGDSVLFNRGQEWREQLQLQSGDSTGYITYGAYGAGAKPKLIGSYSRNELTDWTEESTNIWVSTPTINEVGSELLPNPSFDTNTNNWYSYFNSADGASGSGARTTTVGEYDSAPAGYKLTVTNNGDSFSDVQLFSYPWSITSGKWYKFSFVAKASESFEIDRITLIKSGSPYSGYSSEEISNYPTIGTDFATYTVYFKASVTASDARINFSFGNAIPDGAIFYVDTLSFKETDATDDDFFSVDVGNIVFDDSTIGIKVWEEADLTAQDEFWYDEDTCELKVYSVGNPASLYSSIECCLRKHMINGSWKDYHIVENLELRYGGANGYSNAYSHHNIVRDCDFYWIGGGDQYGGAGTTRFGNAVQWWGDSHDTIVERCYFEQIYDEAITNQGFDADIYNVYNRNNIYYKTHIGITVWSWQGTGHTVHDIYFENNTGLYSGYEAWYDQRPDKRSAPIGFGYIPVDWDVYNIYVRNNILYYSKEWLLQFNREELLSHAVFDNNVYYQPNGTDYLAWIDNPNPDKSYTINQFSTWQSTYSQDANSITSDPLLRSDYGLSAGSPAIDAGATLTEVQRDYLGVIRPQGSGYDIGAYEWCQGLYFNGVTLDGVVVS